MPTVAEKPKMYSSKSSPLLGEVRKAIRLRHMSSSTEASYLYCILDCIRFHRKWFRPRDKRRLGGWEMLRITFEVGVEIGEGQPGYGLSFVS